MKSATSIALLGLFVMGSAQAQEPFATPPPSGSTAADQRASLEKYLNSPDISSWLLRLREILLFKRPAAMTAAANPAQVVLIGSFSPAMYTDNNVYRADEAFPLLLADVYKTMIQHSVSLRSIAFEAVSAESPDQLSHISIVPTRESTQSTQPGTSSIVIPIGINQENELVYDEMDILDQIDALIAFERHRNAEYLLSTYDKNPRSYR